ncbi:hypothetical protein F5051DRAFT_429053 [Lentinula edodes]|nr:hypothetical protein F5051DRAFT_429053 [Lentinula edodes]
MRFQTPHTLLDLCVIIADALLHLSLADQKKNIASVIIFRTRYVVRETLRPHPPFTAINRIATQDDILPPAQPITDSNEKVHNQNRARSVKVKVSTCHMSLLEVNTDKFLWAPESRRRWFSSLQQFDDLRRFQRMHRLALCYYRALLFNTLVRNFEFELGDPKEELMVFKSVQGGIDASYILER